MVNTKGAAVGGGAVADPVEVDPVTVEDDEAAPAGRMIICAGMVILPAAVRTWMATERVPKRLLGMVPVRLFEEGS